MCICRYWELCDPSALRVSDLLMDRHFILELKNKQLLPTSFPFDVMLLDDEISYLIITTYFLFHLLFILF